MNNINLEKIFFNKAISDVKYLETLNKDFFDTPELRELLTIHKDFWFKYHQNPSVRQVKELVIMQGLEGKLSESKIDAIYNEDVSTYDEQWLKENIETFIEYKNLESSIVDISSYLKRTTITSENIKQVVDTVKSTILTKNNIDFTFDEGLDFFNPDSHLSKQLKTFSSGYEFIDIALEGGFLEKSLNVLAGAPKKGKCFIGSTEINVRNKKTGQIEKITVEQFHERIKRSK